MHSVKPKSIVTAKFYPSSDVVELNFQGVTLGDLDKLGEAALGLKAKGSDGRPQSRITQFVEYVTNRLATKVEVAYDWLDYTAGIATNTGFFNSVDVMTQVRQALQMVDIMFDDGTSPQVTCRDIEAALR